MIHRWSSYIVQRVLVGVEVLLLLTARVKTQVDVPFDQWEIDCPHDGDKMLTAKPVLWATPGRAWLSVPNEVALLPSSIPGAGVGAIALTFLSKWTWLGEYDGEVVQTAKSDDLSWYAWKVHRDGKATHYIDGYNMQTSNWLRYINCPRHVREENVEIYECCGKIYYMVVRDIAPGSELLVYYGDSYADELGINVEMYSNMTVTRPHDNIKLKKKKAERTSHDG